MGHASTRVRAFCAMVSVSAMMAALAACAGSGGGGGTGRSLSVTVGNLANNGVVHSGFIVGTASTTAGSAVAEVQVSLDGGPYAAATGTANWSFKLPLPGSASPWKENSPHTIAVRASDAQGNASPVVTLTVRKGVNQDVNGDGYADVVVGASVANGLFGAAYVYLGSATGMSSPTPSTTLNGPAATSYFGWSVALGDVNGDGYADVVVGATGITVSSAASAGAVYVYLGSSSGVSTTASTTLSNPAPAANAYFGNSVALGDVNGDGYADLAVGVSGANTNAGTVFVYLGSGAGMSTSPSSTRTGGGASYYFGWSVALGDVNGDGYADLVVGAYNATTTGNTGAVYVYPGQSGTAGVGGLSTTLIGPASSSYFGWSVALGDVNGDGYADLVVGAIAFSGTWAAYVYPGSGGGLSLSPSTTLLGTASSSFGYSVALGDVNGDGYADLVVGASGVSTSTGAAYVYLGSGTGLTISPSTTLLGTATNLYFGYSVALGDVNGDGYADLVVGAHYADSVYVYQGSGSGVSSTASATLTGPYASSFGSAVALSHPLAAPGAPLLAAIAGRRRRRFLESVWG